MKNFITNCRKCGHVRIQIYSKELSKSMSYKDNFRILSLICKCKKSGNYKVPKMIKTSDRLTLIH